MKNVREKIIVSQTIADDLIAEVSAMLSQNDFEKEDLQPVYDRLKELSNTLSEIPTKDVEF